MKHVAILLLAGQSSRMRGFVDDKVLAPLANKPVFIHSMQAFVESGVVDSFLIVYRDETQKELIEDILKDYYTDKLPVYFAQGGAERRDSVYNGLKSLHSAVKTVYIHDVARPMITVQNLKQLEQAVAENKAATLAHPVTDTIVKIPKEVAITHEPVAHALKPIKRKRLWAMETPQVFDFPLIKKAYQKSFAQGHELTDDVAAASYAGHAVAIVVNESPNIKLTRAEDFEYVEFLIGNRVMV